MNGGLPLCCHAGREVPNPYGEIDRDRALDRDIRDRHYDDHKYIVPKYKGSTECLFVYIIASKYY